VWDAKRFGVSHAVVFDGSFVCSCAPSWEFGVVVVVAVLQI